jgi:transcriptional/translational regulatory protein YebC/TACO1
MFKQKGIIIVDASKASEDEIMETALEAGAEDISTTADAHEITCTADAFEQVKNIISEAGIEIESADLSMVADNDVALDLNKARKVMRLVDALEEHDDVEAVYSNSDIPDEVLEQLAKE